MPEPYPRPEAPASFPEILFRSGARLPMRRVAMRNTTQAQEGTMHATLSDWDLLVALLAPMGSCNRTLTESQSIAVREQCDGFGKMSRGELAELGCLWDWSHVRDSSPEAIERAAQSARVFVGERMATVQEVVSVLGTSTANGRRKA